MKKYLFLMLMFSTCFVFAKENRFDLHLSNHHIWESVILKELKKDSLFFIHEIDVQKIYIGNLEKIFKIRQTKFWKGAGIGLLGGAVIGGIIGRASYEEPTYEGWYLDFGPGFSTLGGAILGGGSGFLVGGVIGAARGGSKKEYDLTELSLDQKSVVVKAIIANQM